MSYKTGILRSSYPAFQTAVEMLLNWSGIHGNKIRLGLKSSSRRAAGV